MSPGASTPSLTRLLHPDFLQSRFDPADTVGSGAVGGYFRVTTGAVRSVSTSVIHTSVNWIGYEHRFSHHYRQKNHRAASGGKVSDVQYGWDHATGPAGPPAARSCALERVGRCATVALHQLVAVRRWTVRVCPSPGNSTRSPLPALPSIVKERFSPICPGSFSHITSITPPSRTSRAV